MAKALTFADVTRQPRIAADHRQPYGADPSQFCDLYLPATPGPHPVIALLHGGCWLADYSLAHVEPLCDALRREGFAVWSVEYRRLGAGGGWPATLQDAAAAADSLRGIAERHALDLSRVVAAGHSAGGHLALWLAARHRLPLASALHSALPLPLRGVLSLAGICDLADAVTRNLCGGAARELMGGAPLDVPDRYAQASPAALLPLGIPHWHLVGAEDTIVPADHVRHFVTAARSHDSVRLDVLAAMGHFEPIVPSSPAWPAVRRAALALAVHP